MDTPYHTDSWICQATEALCSNDNTPSPESYGLSERNKALRCAECKRVGDWPSEWFYDDRACGVLRAMALIAATWKDREATLSNPTVQYARRWVDWLMKDARFSRFIQETRSKDKTFFQQEELRVLPRKGWANGWGEKLKDLKTPEQLTIGEFELALAIFDWDSKTPAFVNWVRSDRYILRRVHRFLLRRSCFELLSLFHRAIGSVRDGGRFSYPGARWFPRIASMCAVGTLGLFGAGDLSTAFDAIVPEKGRIHSVIWLSTQIVLAVASWYGLRLVVSMDLRRQCEDIGSGSEKPRAVGILLWFLFYGCVCSVGVELLLAIRRVPSWPHFQAADLLHLLGVISQGAAIAFTGALVQLLWDDRAATEPF